MKTPRAFSQIPYSAGSDLVQKQVFRQAVKLQVPIQETASQNMFIVQE